MRNGRDGVKSLAAVFQFVAMMLVLSLAIAANTLAPSEKALPRIVQNDIAIEPAAPGPGLARGFQIALLLPLRSPTLAQAAAAVRDGFLAALRTPPHQGDKIAVEIVATSDSVADHLVQYGRVQPNNHMIIGPLTRTAAAALAPVVTQTTLALAPADHGRIDATSAVTNTALAPTIAMGLSIEEEARQLADWASRHEEQGEAWVMSTDVPWQQRAANAFVQQWQDNGRHATVIHIDVASGVLDPGHLSALREKIHRNAPAIMFLALDFHQAVQLREALGAGLPTYGTSQLNPFNAAQWQQAPPVPQLDGVRLLDLPSRLRDDEPTATDGPTLPPAGSADLDRLRALGHDAFLVTQQLLRQRKHFLVEGQTGSLSVHLESGNAACFSRTLTPAIYEDGRVILWLEGQ